MPYILKDYRVRIDPFLDALDATGLTSEVGVLNYVVSRLLHRFLRRAGLSYSSLNAAVGILECVKLELYRQVAAPYEDRKKGENGAVSEMSAPGGGMLNGLGLPQFGGDGT